MPSYSRCDLIRHRHFRTSYRQFLKIWRCAFGVAVDKSMIILYGSMVRQLTGDDADVYVEAM